MELVWKRGKLALGVLGANTVLLASACGMQPDDEVQLDVTEPVPHAEASGGAVLATGGRSSDDSMIVLPSSGGTLDGAGGSADQGSGGGTVDTTVNAECARTQVSAVDTTTTLPADIIILVDTSGSMGEEAAFVQQNLNSFSQQIIDSGVDARVILIAAALDDDPSSMPMIPGPMVPGLCIDPPLGSGSCPDDTALPNYVHVARAVGSNNALDLLISTFPEWRQHLRADSVKSFLVVTDDDALVTPPGQTPVTVTPFQMLEIDPLASADAFLQAFGALDAELLQSWSMNAVFSFTACPEAARPGSVYQELVSRTNGVSGDLCLQDFQPVFDRLAEQVVENAGSEIVCEWEVPAAVDGQTFSAALVEVTRTTTGGSSEALRQVQSEGACDLGAWHFDDPTNPTRILACPQTCEAMQDDAEGKIDVVFGCEIVQGCAASGATSLGSAPGSEAPSDPPAPADPDAGAAPPAQDIGCQWSLPEAASGTRLDLDSVNVRYVTSKGFGVLLGQVASVADCGSVNMGWYYDDPQNPSQIVACPTTCDTLKTASVEKVEALFGCKTVPAEIR